MLQREISCVVIDDDDDHDGGDAAAATNTTSSGKRQRNTAANTAKKNKKQKHLVIDDDENDDDNDDNDDNTPEIPVYARYLSFLCFRRNIPTAQPPTTTVFAQDVWEQYQTWARRNNFKIKGSAADFAKQIAFLSDMDDSGISRQREESDLVIHFNLPKLKECLQQNGLLDVDVW